jgi:hypothetical protein
VIDVKLLIDEPYVGVVDLLGVNAWLRSGPSAAVLAVVRPIVRSDLPLIFKVISTGRQINCVALGDVICPLGISPPTIVLQTKRRPDVSSARTGADAPAISAATSVAVHASRSRRGCVCIISPRSCRCAAACL